MGKRRKLDIRTIQGLVPVLAYARPHWKGIVLSVLLMAIQAGANTGRLVLFYPLLTRVLMPQVEAGPGEASDETTRQEAEDAAEIIEATRKRAGSLPGLLETFTSRVNAITGPGVPQSWLDQAVPPGTSEEDAAVIRAVRRDQYATLLTVLLLFVVATLVMCAASYGETYVSETVRLRILMDVREDLCRKLLDQPIGFYDGQHRGELVQRVLGDVAGYAVALQLMLNGVIRGLLHIVTTIGIMLWISWPLTLICLLGLPFLLPMRTLMKRVLKRAHKRQKQTAKRVEMLLQIFSGIRTVKAFGTEDRRVRDFRATDEEVTHQALKVQRARSAADALTAFINNFLAVLLGIGGGFLILRGYLDVQAGELVVFLVVVGNLYQPIKRVVRQFTSLQDSMASVERTTEYLNLPSGSPDRPDAVAFPGLEGSIRFENVSFAYIEDTPVLEDVSFEIPKGATVALVGPSGGGKSTVCDLLLRFYDPDRGRITANGEDLKAYKRSSLLEHTAVVTQSPFLFHTTIGDNIRQGRAGATQEEVEAAARAAQIHDFIASQPKGYEEEVGESGVRLSGGQRQRMTIARALVRNPEILVLDEATSSLDTSSEQAVQRALEELQTGRTTLVVAHRLSTVRHADRIVVIDRGRVVAQGTHDELLSGGGLYAELVRMQDLSSTKV